MTTNPPTIIRRPDKGLSIAGTRVTLYALMDYVHAGATHEDMREGLNLTDEQLGVALDYITTHREEVEAEYQEVLRKAAEQRRYWEERLREHLARTPQQPPTPEKAALLAKLAEQRRRLVRDLLHDEAPAASGATPS